MPNNINLIPGDTIDVIAPSAKCHPEVITQFQKVMNDWGLKTQVPQHIFGNDLLCANSDEERFQQLKNALTNSNSKAIWCLLGGYGSTRLIPELSKLDKIKQQKLLIGFSDITALHIFLQNKWGWSTIHGVSGRQTALNQVSQESIDRLKQLLLNQPQPLNYELFPMNSAAKQATSIQAPIIGGNLSLIQVSIGTEWQMDATDKILFFEEVNERAYRIDRILIHLKQANIFNKVKAILIGDVTGGLEADGKSFINETLQQFADNNPIPIFRIKKMGHGDDNYPLILGTPSEIKNNVLINGFK